MTKKAGPYVDVTGEPGYGVSAATLVTIARAIERLEGDPRAFLEAVGVSEPGSPTEYVPSARVNQAFEQVERALHTDCLGVHLALASPPGSLGMLDYGLMASRNLEDGLTRAARSYPLVSRRATVAFDARADPPRASLVPRVSERSAVLAEFVLGALVLRMRAAIGGSLRLEGVHFRHEGKAGPLYQSLFAAPVSFGQPLDSVLFDRDTLSAPFRTADPVTAAALDATVARMGAIATVPEDSLPERARAALIAHVSDPSYDVTRLAKHLGMSARTLQRKLQEAGSSHRAIVDAARKEVAIDLIVRPDLSPEHVASTVGFAGARAFYRAFSRWTGMTPAEYRARAAGTRHR